jgi:hypothetical protein
LVNYGAREGKKIRTSRVSGWGRAAPATLPFGASPVVGMARAVRMAEREAVVHVPAIVKAAAVAEPMLGDDGARPVHEGRGKPPSALIEVACGASVMARVGHVAAMREAADAPWLVAGRDEVGDQRLKAGGEMTGDGDRSRRGWNRHHAAPVAHLGAVMMPRPRMHLPPLAGLGGATARVVGGVDVMVLSVLAMVVMMMMMPVSGLRRDRSGQKNGGRCE